MGGLGRSANLAECGCDFDGCKFPLMQGVEQFAGVVVFSDMNLPSRQNPTRPGHRKNIRSRGRRQLGG